MLTVTEKENQNLEHAFDCGFFYPSSPEFAHKLNRNPVAMRRLIVDSASQMFQLMPEKRKITVINSLKKFVQKLDCGKVSILSWKNKSLFINENP